MLKEQEPVRVSLLGYGYAGRTFHAPLIQAVPGLRLVLVGSSRPNEVQERVPGVRVATVENAAVDPDVDLVVIATPNESHFPLAAAALCAGKHVVVDKPFTVTLQQAQDLARIAEQQARLLSVFQNRRWDSEILAAKQVLASGVLGEVTHYEIHMDRFRPTVRKRWREDAGPGAGLWFDLGPHMIDAAMHLFGLPRAVQGTLATLRPGGATDDWGHAVLHYPTMRVVLHASLLMAGGGPRSVMHGTKGSWAKFDADTQEQQLQNGMSPSDERFGVDPDESIFYEGATGNQMRMPSPTGCQQQFYEGMRDAIRLGSPLPVTTAQALDVMTVMDAFYQSATDGRIVNLPTH